MLLGIGALLLLPPGPSARLAGALRYVTEPAQAWSDCAARLASAFVGHTGAEAPQATEQRVLAAEQQLELNALRAAVRRRTIGCSGPEVGLPCCASAEGKQSSVPVGRKVNSTPCGLGWDRSGMGMLGGFRGSYWEPR